MRSLVCIMMPSWLSVVKTALSLTVLFVCFSLERTSVRVDRYACSMHGVLGCHGTSYFPTNKAAACHYARSRPCNQSNRGIQLVTIQSRRSRPSDRDAGGAGASDPWPKISTNNPQIISTFVLRFGTLSCICSPHKFGFLRLFGSIQLGPYNDNNTYIICKLFAYQ